MERLGIISRLKHGWNAFNGNRDPTGYRIDDSNGYFYRPDRVRLSRGNEKSIVTAIYNRIAMDVAAIDIRHVRLDKDGRYMEDMNSKLNECLTVSANLDQTPRAFKQDIVMSMLDEGSVAIVPVETTFNPKVTGSYDIESMRVGKITQWYPDKVKVLLYNERNGKKEEVILPKHMVTIIENPLFAIINEHNSVGQRLIKKLNLLDAIDEQSGSGKLDMIIQLPYLVKTDTRKKEAEERRKSIEAQLANSKYGVAYIDGTEKVTQLNRPLENNLMKTIEYLTNMFYSQLGITQTIMDGTADEKTMLNYTNRTIEPIISAIVEGMYRTFLTKTARSQKQSIMYFRDPFKLVPVNEIAEIADKFTRNEILSKNELREIVGRKPSGDPKADQLINSNLNHPDEAKTAPDVVNEITNKEGEDQNGEV